MAQPSNAVQIESLLNQLPGVYPNRAKVKEDILNLVDQMVSLHPRIASLVYDNGSTSKLLQLYGTVPIFYKGNQYNIPMNIWLLERHPDIPPRCYVTPTKDMRVKDAHKHVDAQGLVYLPYLSEWDARKSNLTELVTFASSVFSEDPPVYRYDPHHQPVHHHQPPHQPHPPQSRSPAPNSNPPQFRDGRALSANSEENKVAALKDQLTRQVTEKLKSTLAAFFKETAAEIDELFDKQAKLRASAATIDQGVARMKRDKTQLQTNIDLMNRQIQTLESWLQQFESQAQIDVDTAIAPSNVLSRQALEAVAEDHAIADTLFALDRAFQDELLDVKTYLKHVRRLARQQFYVRALALKVYEKQAELARVPQFI